MLSLSLDIGFCLAKMVLVTLLLVSTRLHRLIAHDQYVTLRYGPIIISPPDLRLDVCGFDLGFGLAEMNLQTFCEADLLAHGEHELRFSVLFSSVPDLDLGRGNAERRSRSHHWRFRVMHSTPVRGAVLLWASPSTPRSPAEYEGSEDERDGAQ